MTDCKSIAAFRFELKIITQFRARSFQLKKKIHLLGFVPTTSLLVITAALLFLTVKFHSIVTPVNFSAHKKKNLFLSNEEIDSMLIVIS